MSEMKIVRKPRYDGRIKKRQWEERRSDRGEGLDPVKTKLIKKTETQITSDLIEKVKRRKFVLLLAYSGTNFYGMQRNPNTRTIEEVLLESLLKNDYISEENFSQVQTMQFQRAARTDKGVSAARQVVSMKLKENIELEKINQFLPEEVRVFGYRRVTKGFNSKVQCDSRSYFYLLPTVSFVPLDPTTQQHPPQKGFRIESQILERVNELLNKYTGTKNFHNFTAKKKPSDPSAKRFIRSFVCTEPFVEDDVEFVVLKVQGQSFMLHQIRKMIGLVLAIVKGFTGESTLDAAFETERVNVPKAPGLGLVLDFVHYDRYNYRYGDDGSHEKLLWEEEEALVEEFKKKYIYPNIIQTEIKEEAMLAWLEKLSGHGYDEEENENENDEEKVENS